MKQGYHLVHTAYCRTRIKDPACMQSAKQRLSSLRQQHTRSKQCVQGTERCLWAPKSFFALNHLLHCSFYSIAIRTNFFDQPDQRGLWLGQKLVTKIQYRFELYLQHPKCVKRFSDKCYTVFWLRNTLNQ